MDTLTASHIAPVEYAVAVDRYLSESDLGEASRRVYRISLASWAWPLVGKLPPGGQSRRCASPPVVPLAVLDDRDARRRIAAAVAYRSSHAEARTVSREVSALRSAIGWWQRRNWIATDPTAEIRQLAHPAAMLEPLTETQVAALFRLPAGLREQAFWHVLFDSGASAETVLGLDADAVHLHTQRAQIACAGPVMLNRVTADLLGWLLAGRRQGPVFLTDRRAPAGTGRPDICPLTGRGRMSYRRAAEIFAEHTRPLDPARRGWMLHQLRRVRPAA